MKIKNFISDLIDQGYNYDEIAAFLRDGHALSQRGFSDEDQQEIEDEHTRIVRIEVTK